MSENNEIVLRKFRDVKTGEEFDLKTAFIERVIPVPTPVSVPLYVNGELIPEEELRKLDLEIVGYTQEQLDTVYYAELYAGNPDLIPRVRQYRDYLDDLSLPYDATTDQIDAALQAREDLDAAGRLELAARIRTAFQDIVVNLEACGCMTANYEAWLQMPKLVKYLPAEPEPDTAEPEPDTAEPQPEEPDTAEPQPEEPDTADPQPEEPDTAEPQPEEPDTAEPQPEDD